MKFRKKPVVIEAWQVKDILRLYHAHLLAEVPEAIHMEYMAGKVLLGPTHINISTLEGWHLAGPTDWIIQGVKGELYPCKADIFEMTYEKAE